MSEPFLSEIRVFSFSFPPKGWALCNGQLLPINQNQALFALLGRPTVATAGSTSPSPTSRGTRRCTWGAATSSAIAPARSRTL